MELIRFRLIENNISLVPNFEQKARFAKAFNPHVLSMTVYLVIGDLLTGFGHHNLSPESAPPILKLELERREGPSP